MTKEYFADLPSRGPLAMVHVFLEMEGEPILFVAADEWGALYLCHCYEEREQQEWHVAAMTPATLEKLIHQDITVRDALTRKDAAQWRITYDGEKAPHADIIQTGDMAENCLPPAGVTLQYFDRDKAETFLKEIETAQKPAATVDTHVQEEPFSFDDSGWITDNGPALAPGIKPLEAA